MPAKKWTNGHSHKAWRSNLGTSIVAHEEGTPRTTMKNRYKLSYIPKRNWQNCLN